MGARQSNNLSRQTAEFSNPSRLDEKLLSPRRLETSPTAAAPISPDHTGGAHTPNPAPATPSGAGASSSTGWQRERLQRLLRICRCLERGRQQGKPLRKMLVKHAWRWKNRHYACDPEMAIRFTRGTLLRVYYQWKRGGQTPAAIALRYWSTNRKLPASHVLAMARRCAAPNARSFAAAWRQAENHLATYDAFWKAMPPRVRKQLAALCAARRRVEYLERQAQRTVARFAAGLADATK